MSKRRWLLLCMLLPLIQLAAVALVIALCIVVAPPGSGWDIPAVAVASAVCFVILGAPIFAFDGQVKRDPSLRPYLLGYMAWLSTCIILCLTGVNKGAAIVAWLGLS